MQQKSGKEKEREFSNLVQTFQERLYWHIRKMVLIHDDANDVLQNTFMKAWSNIDSFRGDSQISTWLYRIATNETLTFLSKKKMKMTDSLDQIEDVMLQNLQADSYFNGDEVQFKLQKAILTLPEKQRLVFNMRFYDEFSYDEISEILDTSVGALKASYHYAAKKIEKYLIENEENN